MMISEMTKYTPEELLSKIVAEYNQLLIWASNKKASGKTLNELPDAEDQVFK